MRIKKKVLAAVVLLTISMLSTNLATVRAQTSTPPTSWQGVQGLPIGTTTIGYTMGNYSSISYGGVTLGCQVYDYVTGATQSQVELRIDADGVVANQYQAATPYESDASTCYYNVSQIEIDITKGSDPSNTNSIEIESASPWNPGGVNTTLLANPDLTDWNAFNDAFHAVSTALDIIGCIPGCEWIGVIGTYAGIMDFITNDLRPAQTTGYYDSADSPSGTMASAIFTATAEQASGYCYADWNIGSQQLQAPVQATVTATVTITEVYAALWGTSWIWFPNTFTVSTSVILTLQPPITITSPSNGYTMTTGAATGAGVGCAVWLSVTEDALASSVAPAAVQVSVNGGSTWNTATWQYNGADNSSGNWFYEASLTQPAVGCSASYTISARLTYTYQGTTYTINCPQTVTVTLYHVGGPPRHIE